MNRTAAFVLSFLLGTNLSATWNFANIALAKTSENTLPAERVELSRSAVPTKKRVRSLPKKRVAKAIFIKPINATRSKHYMKGAQTSKPNKDVDAFLKGKNNVLKGFDARGIE